MSVKHGLWAKCSVSAAALAVFSFGEIAPALAQVEEITVSATRRVGTTVQDVPLAVSAYGPQDLQNAGVEDVRDLQQISPTFVFLTGQSQSSGSVAAIRGLGTGGDNPGFESAVGFFIDGVYRSRAGTALADLPEIERIEILRGPQGTLFGRNTSAGAVSVITAGPEFEPRIFGSAEYGNYDHFEVDGGVTGPIADSLALRLEAGLRQRDGYIEDVNTGNDINTRDRWFVRGQGQWNISETADLRVIVDAAQSDEECCAALTLVEGATGAVVRGIPALFGIQGLITPVDPESYDVAISPNRDFKEETEDFGVSAELNWDIPWGRLTSISAYRDFEATRNQDIDFSGLDRAYREDYKNGFETFSQEIRLQGEYGILNWLVGAFYVDETATLTDTVRFGAMSAAYVDNLVAGLSAPPTALGFPVQVFGSIPDGTPFGAPGAVPSIYSLANPALAATYLTDPVEGDGLNNDDFETETQSFALFTHNEVSITPDLILTLGLRYNNEDKDVTGNLNSVAPACDELNTPGVLQAAAQGLIAAPASAALAGPAFLLACNPAVNTQGNGLFEGSSSEEEWTGTANLSYRFVQDIMVYGGYTRGYKAGGYNLDRSSFFYNTFSPLLPTPDIDQLRFEPEFVDAYEIGAKLGILDGLGTINVAAYLQEITDFQLNAFSGFNFVTFNVPEAITRGVEVEAALNPLDNLAISTGIAFNEAFYDSDVILPGSTTVALSEGTVFANRPKWTVSSSVTYTHPIPNSGLEALFYVDGRWRSSSTTQTLGRNPASDQDAFAIINGRVGIGPQDGRWAFEVWGRNLFDEFARGGFNVPEQTGTVAVYPNEPRTYGVAVRVDF